MKLLYFSDKNNVDKYVSEANGKKVPKLRQKINNDRYIKVIINSY